MSTLGIMKTRIADELTRDDLSSQIALAITSAIQQYEGERFTFNEKRYLLPTVAGTEYYAFTSLTQTDGSALGTGETLLEIDSMALSLNNDLYRLSERSQQWMDAHGAGSTRGQPYDYAVFSDRVRLYPIPGAVYSIIISGLARLPTLSADGDTSGWMTDGEALIRSEAKAILYRDVLHDKEGLEYAALAAGNAMASLKRKASAKVATGRIAPWGNS